MSTSNEEVDVKQVQVFDGIVPLGEFKARAAKLLKRLGESGEPMVITIQERQRFLESIAAGLADAEAGKVIGTAELKKRFRAWRTERARG